MDLILSLAEQFWQWTVVIILILLGLVINFLDNRQKDKWRVNFKYDEYPHMSPIRIATRDKGFWGAIIMWLLGSRKWKITKDFHYELIRRIQMLITILTMIWLISLMKL